MDDDLEEFADMLGENAKAVTKALNERYPTDAAYMADYEKAKLLFADAFPDMDDDDLHWVAEQAIEDSTMRKESLEQVVAYELQMAHRMAMVMNGGSGASN